MWRSSSRTTSPTSRSSGRRSGPASTTRRSARCSRARARLRRRRLRRGRAGRVGEPAGRGRDRRSRCRGCACGSPWAAPSTASTGTRSARDGCPRTRCSPEVAGSEMFYSSGTTGRPKGVRKPLTLEPAWDGARATSRPTATCTGSTPTRCGSRPARCTTRVRSTAAWPTHRAGGTIVVMERFDAEAGAAADRTPPGHARAVGAHDVQPHAEAPTRRARALRPVEPACSASTAAAPCPVPVKQAMLDWWGPILYEFYAGTEGNGMTLISASRVAGAAGLGRPGGPRGRAHRRRRRGSELGPGEAGTVWFSDGFTFEYHDDPEKTASGVRRARVVDAGRRRLPRRRRLPVPHRPPGVHDHRRRGEHLPARDRGRAGGASRRSPTWP